MQLQNCGYFIENIVKYEGTDPLPFFGGGTGCFLTAALLTAALLLQEHIREATGTLNFLEKEF
jgi:hypothetical protein